MEKIDDEMLLEELKKKFEESRIAVANLRTMTQNLEAVNEKLRQSESLKTDFLSNIRNEINNPLTSIMGLTKQVVDKKADGDRAREIAGMIYHEAFDLDFQLRNIFAAAELEAGETTPSVALVDVAALVRNQLAAFGHKAAEKKVSLDYQCVCPDGDGITFKTDPEWLQKVTANLLANAIEFCHEGKSVALRVWQEGGRLNISIADEGPGIPEADRKKVFDRFVQLDTGVRKRHKGHGLGLSIAKALVEMLNGSIVLAGNKGNGCVFTVSLAEMETGQPVDVTSGDGNEFIFGDGTKF
ncbi:MAG: HAMP domain-containing sensor histidine kinase [Nitrospirota bacterium]